MSKWRVRIEGAGGWAVFNPDRGSKRWFSTHAEALAYADQQARTRKIVLPRQPLPLSLPGPENNEPVLVTSAGDGFVYLTNQNDGDMVVLYKHELRPLALALLAHAERIEK